MEKGRTEANGSRPAGGTCCLRKQRIVVHRHGPHIGAADRLEDVELEVEHRRVAGGRHAEFEVVEQLGVVDDDLGGVVLLRVGVADEAVKHHFERAGEFVRRDGDCAGIGVGSRSVVGDDVSAVGDFVGEEAERFAGDGIFAGRDGRSRVGEFSAVRAISVQFVDTDQRAGSGRGVLQRRRVGGDDELVALVHVRGSDGDVVRRQHGEHFVRDERILQLHFALAVGGETDDFGVAAAAAGVHRFRAVLEPGRFQVLQLDAGFARFDIVERSERYFANCILLRCGHEYHLLNVFEFT